MKEKINRILEQVDIALRDGNLFRAAGYLQAARWMIEDYERKIKGEDK